MIYALHASEVPQSGEEQKYLCSGLYYFSVVGLFFKYDNVIFVESIKAFTKNNRISNEDTILALAGQFKQLSHEPEKFR